MKNPQGSHRNLHYVVSACLADIGATDLSEYQRFMQWAILGYMDLNLFVLPSIKVAYLNVRDNLTADLPFDYIDYTKVGICVNDKIVTLGLNNNLCLPRKVDSCGDIIGIKTDKQSNNVEVGGYSFVSHYRNGQYVGEMFGVGGGFTRGMFRIDEERRQIALDGELPKNEIILEYKSNGLETDGSALVPIQAIKALRAWVHYQRADFDRKAPMNEKEHRREVYYIEYDKLQHYTNTFTMSEYLDSQYRTFKQTPKR